MFEPFPERIKAIIILLKWANFVNKKIFAYTYNIMPFSEEFLKELSLLCTLQGRLAFQDKKANRTAADD